MRDDTSRGPVSAREDRGAELAELGLPLEELVRRGARDILQRAIEAELGVLLDEFASVSLILKRVVRARCGPFPARGEAPQRRNPGYAGAGRPGGGCNSRPLRYFTRARESTRYQRCRGVNCSAVWRSVWKKAAISRQALSTQAASACG